MNRACTLLEVNTELNKMEKAGQIFVSSYGFYSRTEQIEWSEERKKGNNRAELLLQKVPHFAKVISRFPFVKSITISGSLSKYYAGEDTDIDYFIVTEKNRLWIARTLLHFYKKFTFLIGHEHFYCMNYFIDEIALELKDKNIYAAIEIATLIPVYNTQLIQLFKQKNKWLFQFLPNETLDQDERFVLTPHREVIKNFWERTINYLPADRINHYFMRITDRKWRAKWKRKKYPMEQYDEAMFTSLHVSKNHPANFQSRVLEALKDDTSLKTEPTCVL